MEGNTIPFNRCKSRQALKYKKITNQTREKLIEMVFLKEIPLKNAADTLNINYSTAKTILRIFRVEKRMAKKNSVDESELKKLLIELKNKKNTEIKEVNHTSETNDKENVMSNSLNEMNQKLDVFNHTLNNFKDILKNSFQNIISTQELIQDMLDLTKNLQENFLPKENSEPTPLAKNTSFNNNFYENYSLLNSLTHKNNFNGNGFLRDYSNDINNISTKNSCYNQSPINPIHHLNPQGPFPIKPYNHFQNMVELFKSYDPLKTKKINLNYKYFN